MSESPDLVPRYAQLNHDYGMVLATTPPEEDGPVWMVNLMRYRERADYADGRDTDLSGREADDTYAPVDELAAVGAEIVFVGDVETQLLGQPTWDRVAVVKYPTRRSFIELQSVPGFAERHAHKEAGMEQTIVIGGRPLASPGDAASMGPDWADVPHPPTDEDGPVQVIHVLRFEESDDVETPGLDGSDADHMAAYQRGAAPVAIANGVRIAGWFCVDGTILGDGREWDQVRFNTFPSREAFMTVALDPDRLEAQRAHRETAIADTFTLIVRPVIDRLAESIKEGAPS